MIITVGGEKGGSGKTTVAINFAAINAEIGNDVLLVNGDPQNTAGLWAAERQESHPEKPQLTCVSLLGDRIGKELQKLSEKYETIIVDAGGRDSVELRAALVVSDLLVIPCQPTNFDGWTLERMSKILDLIAPFNPDLPAKVVSSRVHPSSVDGIRKAMTGLIGLWPRFELMKTIITNRASYQISAGDGISVTEMARHDVKAVTEMFNLFEEVF